jgi:hypothetical protein
MYERKILVVALLAAGVICTTPAMARSQVYVTIGPPPPIVEVVPPPRHGYVWAPGYWRWNGHKHVWAKGQWKRQYHGREWIPDQWVQRGDRWYLERGHWG